MLEMKYDWKKEKKNELKKEHFFQTTLTRPKVRIFAKGNRHFYNRNFSTIFFSVSSSPKKRN